MVTSPRQCTLVSPFPAGSSLKLVTMSTTLASPEPLPMTVVLTGGCTRLEGLSEPGERVALLKAQRHDDGQEAFEVLDRLFEQAERISLQGWHFAGEEAGTPGRDSEAALWLGDGDEVD